MSVLKKLRDIAVGAPNMPDPAPAPDEKPLYITPGKEGTSNVTARRIVAFVKLPDRREIPVEQRYATLEADMREAMAKGARQVAEQASKHNVFGYTFTPDDITYDVAHIADPATGKGEKLRREVIPTLVVSLVARRKA